MNTSPQLMALITAPRTHPKFQSWPLVLSPSAAFGVNLFGSLPHSCWNHVRLAFFYPHLTPLPATRAWEVRPWALSAQTSPSFPEEGKI